MSKIQALQMRLDQEVLLNQITVRIHRSLELQKILATATAEIRAFLNTDRVIIYRFYSEVAGKIIAEDIEPERLPSLLEQHFTLEQIAPFSCKAFLKTRQGLVIDVANQQIGFSSGANSTANPLLKLEVASYAIHPGHLQNLQALGVQSALIVPLVFSETPTEGKIWGLLISQHATPRPTSAAEVNFVQRVTDHLLIAISQAELLQQAHQQVQQEADINRIITPALALANVLKRITNQIRSTLNSETVLRTIVREVRLLLNTDRVVMYRLGPSWVGEVVVEEVVEPWESILGKTYRDDCFPEEHGQWYLEGRVRAINHVAGSDLAACHKQLLQTMQVQANLVVPIRITGELWGLLIVHECHAPRLWQKFEIDLLQQLADQAAIAIQQAELYEQSCVATASATATAQRFQQTATDLAQALQDLQKAQSQLVQTEKMSSLGQLVAGVAHEINNPINIIYGNLSHAESYAQGLLNLIAAYREQCPQPDARTQAILDALDLDFTTEDFPKLLGSMKIGSDRIRQIVQSLRNFSRLDEAAKKPVNIHEGIDSTLLILQHRLKANTGYPNIQVVREYGDLPLVECYPGQINQVFINLISNAIDTLEEKTRSQPLPVLEACPNQITIRTSLQNRVEHGSRVVIQIADNGLGMSDEVKARLFDPFFTTKPVGKGTGLGLSISYQIIVENHNGLLKFISQLGQGSEFWIEIPLIA